MADAVRIARECGIVGAGGAGFPAHAKFSAKADTFIVNAAECEPLLYKDQEILENFLEPFAKGLLMAAEAIGASRAVVGIKEKHARLIEKLKDELPREVELSLLRDTYPSGDEFILVYDVTGRAVPRGGLPLDVGVVCSNVETVLNIGLGRPVTEKFVTVSGAVPEAVTFKVPIGASYRDVLLAAGAPLEDSGFIIGGPMMGFVEEDLLSPVTKTCSGILVLPKGHPLLSKKARKVESVHKIAYSCDQCMRCSDLCPRDLLGHGVKPHKAMIAIAMAPKEAEAWQQSALYCCECALCTLYACPEDLDPFRVMVEAKRALRERGFKPAKAELAVAPMYPYRRTPTSLLVRRLGLEDFIGPHRFAEITVKPKRLVLPLKQHIGAPSLPMVANGDNVRAGQLVGEIPEGALGSRIFTPLKGVVSKVTRDAVMVEVT
ncbi:MAG: SLBB domain-containing protein [Acidobacteria bacterium]|nr:SLBB domain-containing protein [Acidobacteriota bacterium]